jgi:hypothetical protein
LFTQSRRPGAAEKVVTCICSSSYALHKAEVELELALELELELEPSA